MTIKELFEKVYALPVDKVGMYEHENGALHIYQTTGPQFNILREKNGEVLWNVIKIDEYIKIVPVVGGASQWNRSVEYLDSDDVEDLPLKVYRLLEEANLF